MDYHQLFMTRKEHYWGNKKGLFNFCFEVLLKNLNSATQNLRRQVLLNQDKGGSRSGRGGCTWRQ